MMVLASIYLYVSGSLPTTSAIKPVEIWLIFNLVYPCFIILSNVLLQVGSYLSQMIGVLVSKFQVLDTPEKERKVTPANSKVFLSDKKSPKPRRLKFVKQFAYFYNPVLYVTFALLYFAFYFTTLSNTGHDESLD